MLRLRYTVPFSYSKAAEQFVNDPWVHRIVKLASEHGDIEVYNILSDGHRRHYDFPFDLFMESGEVDKELIVTATPGNVITYDTDSA